MSSEFWNASSNFLKPTCSHPLKGSVMSRSSPSFSLCSSRKLPYLLLQLLLSASRETSRVWRLGLGETILSWACLIQASWVGPLRGSPVDCSTIGRRFLLGAGDHFPFSNAGSICRSLVEPFAAVSCPFQIGTGEVARSALRRRSEGLEQALGDKYRYTVERAAKGVSEQFLTIYIDDDGLNGWRDKSGLILRTRYTMSWWDRRRPWRCRMVARSYKV
jgi:hypothetical protein